MKYYIQALRKYAVFRGRASRKEFWMFFLFNLIFSFVIGFVDNIVGARENIVVVYELAILVPYIAIGARRMHDTDHSGWWLLVPIANLVFMLTAGTVGENRFGADPRTVDK